MPARGALTEGSAFDRRGLRHYVSGTMALRRVVRYLANLTGGRLVLGWYLIWYLVVLVRYFDPNPRLWLTSLGLTLIIGTALLINTTRSGKRRVVLETWPTLRLFMTPFCVSSFSALVKGKGFILIFSPHLGEMLVALGACVALWIATLVARRVNGAAPEVMPTSSPSN